MFIPQGSGPLGSGPTGHRSGFSVMPFAQRLLVGTGSLKGIDIVKSWPGLG